MEPPQRSQQNKSKAVIFVPREIDFREKGEDVWVGSKFYAIGSPPFRRAILIEYLDRDLRAADRARVYLKEEG